MGRIVGIDLGTTNSLVACMRDGKPTVIPGADGSMLVPSVVAFADDGLKVGELAKHELVTHPERTVYSIKRFMGKGYQDVLEELKYFPIPVEPQPEGIIRIQIGGRAYTPPEISAVILSELKRRAEQHLNEPITQAVITVPAYFNDSQRQATKDAGRLAGLEVERIVNEPTAACLAYGLHNKKQGLVAVYDLGGGTFDISILKLRDGVFEVLATNGNTRLGGDDLDRSVMDRLVAEIEQRFGRGAMAQSERRQELRLAAEEAKKRLSSADAASIDLAFPGGRYQRRLTRAELSELARPWVASTIEPCRQALADAKLRPDQIDEVVLVGGSTRMPLVRQVVQEFFGRPPHTELDPDEVVALGAAIQADILAGGTLNMLLLDVTPLSLGIETMGGVTSVLIPRNTTIPTSAKELFTTFVDGQRAVGIHVLQGERELAKDNRSLARFELRGIDPLPAGMARVEVTFMIDANGILNVAARDQRSGEERSVQVTPSYGLTDEEVSRMLAESVQFAEADAAARKLVEARNQAATILHHTGRALEQARAAGVLERIDHGAIEAALAALKAALQADDADMIRGRITALDQATLPLAEVLMHSTVKTALEGKSLGDLP
jgi:Fe-S protein assembly chaperone HscA